MKATFQHIAHFGWIVTSIALVVLIAFHVRNIRRIEHLEETNRQLNERCDINTEPASNIIKSEQIADVDEDESARSIEIFDWDIQAMKKAGLKDPLNDIISDLKRHRELIPYEGSMGGTMNFLGPSKMWILTKKWVLAYFEDGHNGGYLLLEYNITKGGGIHWTILASSSC